MAEETKNTTISKTNAGFPDYLDFDKLRTEGIDYLGRLTGKIWTDYNVHDPGITILEILCYALLDLGYRTNLPAIDIFTTDSKSGSADNNFYTPSQILTCNPLTVMDFRKLLIDINGVKNAWLEVEPNAYNGLYHVYLELDNEVEKEDEKVVVEKVRKALMTHRNLCEDFVDIVILCKKELGLCVDIELEENTDAEQVYLSVVEKLKDFFSPAPRFYTLQQLLEKQKPIDEIFAGRPFNITESHGFVDTDELRQLTLRKAIHLSDVYHAIFEVEGVKGVNDLHLRSCNGNGVEEWKGWRYRLPENHVPEFSLSCSGFQFYKKGRPVFVDFQKFVGLFAINFTHNGKVSYQMPSPYLDLEIPQGVYHNDLADYYSIQNEFPRVYGIAEGGLSEKASPERRAQAFQLKAWLLFFDQLLANYLTQLKNIPSLFAMSSSEGEDPHTYFINRLTTAPDHQKLVRFNLDEHNENTLGAEGDILVFPVDKKELIEMAEQDKLKTLSPDNVEPYNFKNIAEQNTAINQLKNDLFFEQYHCEYVAKTDGCIFYYIDTGSNEFVLLCKKYFKNIEEAKAHASSIHYIGSFEENYSSFFTADDSFSFNIELNLLSFSKYLQLIVEDKALFYKRRQGFLNHLLARFAEQFADYALLAFGFQQSGEWEVSEIKAKENYLTRYDDLSGNRGKAYDYLMSNRYPENRSGFEKKVRALSGMNNEDASVFCNFVVAKYDEQYAVTLKLADTSYFSTEDKFDSEEEGLKAAQSLFLAMKKIENYRTKYIFYDKNYKLEISYAVGRKAFFPLSFDTENEAMDTAGRLTGLFFKEDPEKVVFVSSYIYIPELRDASGQRVRRSVAAYDSEDKAKAALLKTIKKIDDPKVWEYEESGINLGLLYRIPFIEDHLSFLNVSAFKIDIDNSVIDKPDVFTYEALDKDNSFKFNSIPEFNTANNARKAAHKLLALLTDEAHYEIFQEDVSKFRLRIRDGENIEAICSTEISTEEEGLKLRHRILRLIKRHQYSIALEKQADRWKFDYLLGYEKGSLLRFESVEAYHEKEKAVQAAAFFMEVDPELQWEKNEADLTLTAIREDHESVTVNWVGESKDDAGSQMEGKVKRLLAEKNEVNRLNKNNQPEDFKPGVHLDERSKEGLYVYRLVDRNHIPAFNTLTFKAPEDAKNRIKALSKRLNPFEDYLQVCLGGENLIHQVKDEDTNKYRYHYQVRSLNNSYQTGDKAGMPLVLFESIKGYETAEEAEEAFNENYLFIIRLASDASHYNREISFEESGVRPAYLNISSESIVFIPKATLEDLGGPELAIKTLVTISLSYPIRAVTFQSKEFYDLFPCEEADFTGHHHCKKEEEKRVYYFLLKSQEDGGWQSTKYYTTPAEAKRIFDFFMMLLPYYGNYFVDYDDCNKNETESYHIYIREVLAEGTERFGTEEEAWSNEGLQNFIRMAQSEGSFHPYFRTKEGCFSYYISCKDNLIYHPCKYDTSQKRDKALLALYQSLKEQLQKRAWQPEDSEKGLFLLNESGEPFAVVESLSKNYCKSDLISLISEQVDKEERYEAKEGRIILKDDNNIAILASTKEGLSVPEWKMLLQTFICLYPVIRTDDPLNEGYLYEIEIKLPGFNDCSENLQKDIPCGCGKAKRETFYQCDVAWKSRSFYKNCWEAERALQIFLNLLQRYEFYRPVFDCECHSFGIALQFEKQEILRNERLNLSVEESGIRNWSNGEMTAVNPQCYPSREAVCDAVNRAKLLINSEGFHLVEHILLRPRCPEEEPCAEVNQSCEEVTGCDFEWHPSDTDPCQENQVIHFVPGSDPYSFIATVVLPAWPERFRKKGNRALLENILYREAPAHVLLRILWLAPHDFCCFERKFGGWNRWLALKKNCKDDFSNCDFMKFLFNNNYEQFEEYPVCGSSGKVTTLPLSCSAGSEDQEDEKYYLNQINAIYCWRIQNSKEYQYRDCGTFKQNPGDYHPDSEGKLLTDREDRLSLNTEISDSFKRKSQLINARIMKYKKLTDTIVEETLAHPLAVKAQSFLADPQPAFSRFSGLASEILQNGNSKKKESKALSKTRKLNLLKSVTCYWLDRFCFNGKDQKELNKLSDLSRKLDKANIKTASIFRYWNFSEMEEYVPEINTKDIKTLFYATSH